MLDLIKKEEMLRIPAEEISVPDKLPDAPIVSIAMMTRNHESFITQAVESVAEQQCDFPIELIIGEDFSTDGTRTVCEDLQKQYPYLIRLIVASENVGITKNFLRLVSRSKGKYIALLEGDDYWTHPEKLKKQVALMERHPDYSWCGAKTLNRTFWAEEKVCYTLEDTLHRYIFHTSSIMFRSDMLETYPHFPDIVVWESMLYAYLAKQGKCGFLNEVVSYYRRHEGGLYTGVEMVSRIQFTWICTDTMDEYFGSKYRRILYDRELWVYKMETSIHIGKDFWQHWIQSLSLVHLTFSRMIKVVPCQYFLFALQVWLQPFTAAYLTLRRKLALRNRVATLKEIIGRFKYRF